VAGRRTTDEAESAGRAMRLFWILVGGAVVPAVILAGLTVATIRTSARIAGAGGGPRALVMEVVGHQFWWEARYPGIGCGHRQRDPRPGGRATACASRPTT
jgi:cytochrome c oxidase subunit II